MNESSLNLNKIETLRTALKLKLEFPYPEAAQFKKGLFSATGRKTAAVLMLFSFSERTELLLIERSPNQKHHAGQIAFPGGAVEGDEDFTETALREANEEVGVKPESIEVLGILPPLPTLSSQYWITPVVAASQFPKDRILNRLQETEVADAFWCDWVSLMDQRTTNSNGWPEYQWRKHRIWGASAFMIEVLKRRLDYIQNESPT